MSVLIEAICLVVPRQVLDVSFPGGTDAFISECAAHESVRYAIADSHVTAVSTFDPQALDSLVERMADLGIVGGHDSAFEFVFVDMQTGPAVPCEWLSITHHRHGFTIAEMTSRPICAFTTPDGWLLEQSWRLIRADIRDDGPGAVLPLGIDDGIETVLDLRSGRLLSGAPERPSTVEHVEAEGDLCGSPARDERWMAAHRVFVSLGVPHQILTEQRRIAAPFALDELRSPYDGYFDGPTLRILIGPADDPNAVECEVILPTQYSLDDVAFCGPFVEWEAKERYGWSEFASELQHDRSTGTISVRHLCVRKNNESWDTVVERACTESSARGTVTLVGFEKFSRADVADVIAARARVAQQSKSPADIWDKAETLLRGQVSAARAAGVSSAEIDLLRNVQLACGRVLTEQRVAADEDFDFDDLIRRLEAELDGEDG